ncbi:hypothetical protein GCM10023311_17740 [Flaviramulus aquimarinus]|uniref:Anti-sigma factor n=1 Tax=Flaviramulus aquimarinus TaxID=1170456 RepID=A0ABP9F4H1_9FLAO
MEPIKVEEHIKEKLDKRTLQPSADAWNRLSERLDNQGKNKNNTPYWWLGIAASVIGILFVVTQFSDTNKVVEEAPKIVITPEAIQQEKKETIKVASVDIENKVLNKNERVIYKDKTLDNPKAEKLLRTNRINKPLAIVANEKSNPKEEHIQMNSPELPKENLTFENQEIQNIVAQVQALRADKKDVTDEDIDALLIEAQKEIQLNRLINETTGVVDANILLQEVESDLDQSFRNKVFEAIKASYNSVKIAVVQRND